MPADVYVNASFRIYGEGFDPTFFLEEIEAKRTLPSANKGVGVWTLHLDPPDNEDINEHLSLLFSILERERTIICELRKTSTVNIQFYVTIAAYFPTDVISSGRVIFSPETHKKIASLDAELVLDFYASDEDDDD